MRKGLPDYEMPPVIEVVCGILFEPIKALLGPHLGLLWEKYKPEYPICREVPPLTPVIENFNEPRPVDIHLSGVPPLPRIWFVHRENNGIIQIQRDRFLHNWKKAKPEDEYPRYPKVIKLFKDRLSKFELFLEENEFRSIEPLQYEMTYINHIPKGDGWVDMSNIGEVFPDFAFKVNKDRFLRGPEGINWRTSFTLPDQAGRMHVTIQYVKARDTGQPLLILNLTVRGIGNDKSSEGMWLWFDLAREWIVRGFADLTGEEVQKNIWKKKN